MIFAKDYSDSQLPYTKSDRYMSFKVIISSVFLAVSIFLYLIGQESIIGVFVLFAGIVWNIFLPIKNMYSIVMSIIMGILYGLVCHSMGLVANAFLYLVYYVPMQCMMCRNKEEGYILQNKQLTESQSLFVLVYYVLFFVGIYVFSSSIKNSWMCFMDSMTASLLAVSALCRNLRIKDYYKARLIALAASIFMWSLICSSTVIYAGAASVLLMYVMYFVYEIGSIIYEKRHYNTVEMQQLQERENKKTQVKIQKKKEELAKQKNSQK